MKKYWRKWFALLLAGALFLGLCACGVQENADEKVDDPAPEETFRAVQLGLTSGEEFSFPYLGMRLTLPDSLGRKMDNGSVFCQTMGSMDGTKIRFAALWWDLIPEELRDAEFAMDDGDGVRDWLAKLERVGVIGVYQDGQKGQLDELTGCDSYMVLGEQEGYQYVLSLRGDGDAAAVEELRQVSLEIIEMLPLPEGTSPFAGVQEVVSDLGDFVTQDIYGQTVTPEIFADYKLTLVNLFTTWCQPCLGEIPELDKLRGEMAGQGVNVIGIVLDAAGADGEPLPDTVALAKEIQSRTGVQYPFLLPDKTLMNDRLAGVSAVPETFFVDSEGKIVGETYVGARDLAAWTEIAEAELAALGS